MHKKGNGKNLKSKESHEKKSKEDQEQVIGKSCEIHFKFMRNNEKIRKK